MLTQIKGPDHHFKAFYQDNSILIQFMIEEFIRSYQLNFQIKLLMQEHLESTRDLDTSFASLIQMLGQLIGYSSPQTHASFSWNKGPLTKFKEYCEQFSRNSSHQDKQHVNLHMATHHAWLMALYNLELLNSLYSNSYVAQSDSLLFLIPLKRAFQSLQMRFKQISRYLPHVSHPYRDNENVILCLLRRKDLLQEIYGSDFLYKRFKWPMKTSELVAWLMQRYQARGFEALLPTIQYLSEPEAILNLP